MLGGLRVRQGERVVSRFQTQKTGALLAYLALHSGRSFPRETMAEVLWPDGDPSAIRNRLNQAISSLRRQLHPPGCEPGYVLQADHLALQVNTHTVVTDVAEFEAALRAAEEDEANTTQHLRQAVDLYQGEYLDGYYEEWALLERVRLSDLYYDALSRLIRAYAQAGRISEAIEVAIRRLAIDPSDERAHRALMRLYLAAGRPRSALAQYHELVRALALDDETPSERAERLRDEALASLDNEDADLDVAPEHTGHALGHTVEIPSGKTRALPRYLTRLWGRDEELSNILSLWESGERLITLTGIGGIGKTRLAVESAWRSDAIFGERVAFASMAEYNPQQSILTVAVQSVFAQCSDEPITCLRRWSEGERALLVLDNLEHVGDSALAELADALTHLPEVFVIATSWHPLDIDGEHVITVRPLPIPTEASGVQELAKNPAIALFVDRAQSARQDFQLTERTSEAIQSLCRRLEGVPLALELAASWARTLTASQMVDQVTEHYDRLTSRRKDLAPRHRSMRAVIDGSYRMLPEDFRNAFVRLSVFVGSWDHAAATQVCSGTDVFEMLQALEESGLVQSIPSERGLRFSMLETVRAFCRDQMTPDLVAEVGNVHAEYYAALVARAIRREAMTGLHLIAEENGNCVAALRHFVEVGRFEEAAQLGADLALYWDASGRVTEGKLLLRTIAEHVDALPASLRGLLFSRQARLAWRMGNYARSQELNEQAIRLFTENDDLEYLAETRLQLALEAHRNSDFIRAEAILRENLETVRSLEDVASEARNMLALGNTLVEQHRWDEAEQVYDETLILARRTDRPHLIGMPLANLGNLKLLQGKPDAGKPLLEEARILFDQSGFRVYERDCRRMIAFADRLSGKADQALESCRLLLRDPTEEVPMVWSVLLECAYDYRALGDMQTAARLMGVVETLWETTSTRAFGVEAQAYEAQKSSLCEQMGESSFHEAFATGRRLDSAAWHKLVGLS